MPRKLPAAAPSSYLEVNATTALSHWPKLSSEGGAILQNDAFEGHATYPSPAGYRIRNSRPSPASPCTTRLLALPFCLCCRPG